jgi:polysaccharide biosynthesis/export protein
LKTFVIGPDDVVGIKVWREPELSSTLRVRPDGKITLPLGGEVKAAGRTPEQLGEEITKMLGSFVNSPLVMVSVVEVRSKKYSITGEVNKPGAYPLIVPTSVLDAILQAGGFKEYAKKGKVTVLRNGTQLKFNYGDYVKNKKKDQNVQLQDGDLIVVP